MSLYALSQRTTATAAASASWEVIASATNKPRIMEVGISQNTAVSGVYGLGRPAATGVTPTTPQNFQQENDSGASTSQTTAAIAWGTGPTIPANFNRRITCPATVGAGVIWTFPRGLDIAVTKSIIIWILATAPVCDVWSVVDE